MTGRTSLLAVVVGFGSMVGVWAPAHAQLVASVLPASRSVQVGSPATAFATIINSGASLATGCGIALSGLPANFLFQTTDPSTNVLTGTPNTRVSIPGGEARTFLLAITPTSPIASTNAQLVFDCDNTPPAPSIPGLNTLLLSASTTPVPDLVALAATASNDGIVVLAGASAGSTGAFSVASVNVGTGTTVTVSVDTGAATLPVTTLVCRTNATTGQCVTGVAPSITVPIGPGETPTFSAFINARGSFPFNPAISRAFMRLRDAGGVTRGSTSVALQAPTPTDLAGTWHLSASGTAVSDSGAREPFSFSLPPFPVTQTGNSLSGTVLMGDIEDSLDLPLPPSCSFSCGAPGSCTLTCPGLSCAFSCSPATTGCAERSDLTGTLAGTALDLTVRSNVGVDASCSGAANGTLFARETTVITGQGTAAFGPPPTASGPFTGRTDASCGGTGDFAGALECIGFNSSGTFNLTVNPSAATLNRASPSRGQALDAVLDAIAAGARR